MHHMTLWPLGGATEVKASVSIRQVLPSDGAAPESAEATLQAVYAESIEDMLSGDYAPFSGPISLNAPSFAEAQWAPIPSRALSAGEVYVSFVLSTSLALDALELGHAEVRIR